MVVTPKTSPRWPAAKHAIRKKLALEAEPIGEGSMSRAACFGDEGAETET